MTAVEHNIEVSLPMFSCIAFTDNQLEILYPPIRMKLGVALNNWQPSDSSALVILRPWAKVNA